MVVVKFQMFMQRAVSHMKLLQFPLYVTAHDFDFIACFDPRPESAKPRIRKQSVEELTRDLITKLSDDHPHTRFRAAIRLQTIGPAAIGAVAALLERLSDSEMSIRQAAVAALAKIDPESDLVVSALVARLNVDQPLWDKRNIVQALGECPTKKAIEALAMALFDEHTEVRRAAAISLKILGIRAKEAAPALRKLLETELNRDIRTQATTALEMMRQE